MTIIEDYTNFPTVLGRRNIPAVKSWGSGRIIGNLPSVARERQGLFPQVFRKLRAGRSEVSGQDLSIYVEEGQMQMNAQHNAQLTKYPIIPLLDRPHPVFDAIKARATIAPRTKMIGVFGIIDPTENPTGRNIPVPWGPRTWPTGAEVGRLPSVVQTGAGASGPTRTMHPEISLVV